jgi:hypothetical protein
VVLLAAAGAVGALLGAGGGGTNRGPLPVRASRGAVRAFLARASLGIKGTYSLSYEVTVRYPWGIRRVQVAAAQRSPRVFMYRETPSIELIPASHIYDVFVLPARTRQPGAKLYSCRQALPRSRWSCNGPFTGIGMGGTGALIGPYPPRALVIGLENAADIFTGVPAPPATQPEPAFLFTRRLSGRDVRCLGFGRMGHLLGSVCLDRSGIVAYYDLPQRMTYSAYSTAVLRSYSRHASPRVFTLPATPEAVG